MSREPSDSLAGGPSSRRSRPRVLLVDDDHTVRRALVRVLEHGGFDVQAAEDGLQAIQLLSRGAFDVVLTDVMMPGLTGIDVLRAVREKDLDVPVLLITGAPNVASAVEAVRYGATDYVTKPFDIAALEKKVGHAVDLRRLAQAKREAIRLLGSRQPEAGDLAGLEVTLERALASLWMAYQPIVKASDHAVFAYEALLRSNEAALPHPGAVLDAAERLGRLEDVGRAVRAKAPEPFGRASPSSLLFVNLHVRDLLDETLASSASPLVAMASRVVLEITERESLDGVDGVRQKISTLRDLGFRIAVDDLGAGYAGLSSFTQLEPEFVKLDMSLVRDVHDSPVRQKLVRSMTDLCRDMGISVVAEGIETPEERDVLVDLGCDLLQGYRFARPGPAFPTSVW